MLRPFSDRPRGLFVTVDGPSGAGKSTVVEHLAQLLVADGEEVHVTAEPSSGPIGGLCRELTETVTGHALACLYAADRYHHLEAEIRPATDAGRRVISDRYIPSGLVMQRFDGIDPAFLWQLNAEADRPDLAVIIQADPEIIARRLRERGAHKPIPAVPRQQPHRSPLLPAGHRPPHSGRIRRPPGRGEPEDARAGCDVHPQPPHELLYRQQGLNSHGRDDPPSRPDRCRCPGRRIRSSAANPEQRERDLARRRNPGVGPALYLSEQA